ncbi:hypothetical protein [Moorena sp. SIO4G3]|uniref:hypothetical protein n=1 Tax=Moorena sp. SIO4G3 TaxID=2607821 RepID=UPI001428E42D|nr:hypothetical protein [Moorena sp. SIO4G3]NEO80868.1 hypothetical protein [Moorena sp. SIO4G3]
MGENPTHEETCDSLPGHTEKATTFRVKLATGHNQTEADQDTGAKGEGDMGKQILEKCLTREPQSEQNMWTLLSHSHSVLNGITVNSEKIVGKMNRPKSPE